MKRSRALTMFALLIPAILLLFLSALWLSTRPTKGTFQRHFARELTARFPESRLKGKDLSCLECDLGDGLVLLNLEALFKAWQHDRMLRDTLVTRYLSALAKSKNIGKYKQVAGRIFPQIRPQSFADIYPGSELTPVSAELFGGLAIFYGVEFPDRTVYITGRHLAEWRVNQDTIHKAALDNLFKRTRAPFRPPGSPGLYAYLQGDGYDASRVLILDRLKEDCGNISEPFFFALPHRDALYILNTNGLNNIKAPLDRLEALTRHLYRSSYRFLCAEVMVAWNGKYMTLENYRAQDLAALKR